MPILLDVFQELLPQLCICAHTSNGQWAETVSGVVSLPVAGIKMTVAGQEKGEYRILLIVCKYVTTHWFLILLCWVSSPAECDHVVDQILFSLDATSLRSAELVSTAWRDYIARRRIWQRALQSHLKRNPDLAKSNGWDKFVSQCERRSNREDTPEEVARFRRVRFNIWISLR